MCFVMLIQGLNQYNGNIAQKKKEVKMDTVKIEKGSVLMVAHRGLSGIEKENTIAAFVAAGNRSYYGIETDVHRTADGKYIIIHDSNTKRVSGVSCTVEETNFDTLRSIRLKDTDNESNRVDLYMPSLEEYVKICKKYNKVCVLELKEVMTEDDVIAIAEIVANEGYIENTIFISFEANNLIFLKKHYPNQTAQYLFGKLTDEICDFLVKYKIDIDMYCNDVTKEVVEKAHSLGLKVNCWTVDNPDEAARVIDCGVDFITSDILE